MNREWNEVADRYIAWWDGMKDRARQRLSRSNLTGAQLEAAVVRTARDMVDRERTARTTT